MESTFSRSSSRAAQLVTPRGSFRAKTVAKTSGTPFLVGLERAQEVMGHSRVPVENIETLKSCDRIWGRARNETVRGREGCLGSPPLLKSGLRSMTPLAILRCLLHHCVQSPGHRRSCRRTGGAPARTRCYCASWPWFLLAVALRVPFMISVQYWDQRASHPSFKRTSPHSGTRWPIATPRMRL